MTGDRPPSPGGGAPAGVGGGGAVAVSSGGGRAGLGPLGRRLLAAFVGVACASVALITVAALIGTGHGLSAAQDTERRRVAERVAEVAAAAYAEAGGWYGADLAPLRGVVDAEGLSGRPTVRDVSGAVVWSTRGMGPGMHASGATTVRAPVTVAGSEVGTVDLTFGGGTAAGRAVAWTWVAVAAAVALLVALVVSWAVSRRLTAPLVTLAAAARAFAGGDRSARSRVRPPGELGELARAFDSMADDVARAEGVRRRLAADVAHELRTPLAALQAGLEELRDGLRAADPARLGSLHDQTLRLGRVVEDLAELAAAESAALSLRRRVVDLAAVAGAAADGHEARLRAAGLDVCREISGPVPVLGDPDRLHQALANLLANTARYCRPGDRVTLRVAAAGPAALAQVTDTGPGIGPAALPHIFERLWRGPGTGPVAGSGIGLAVVRELVTAHGGTVGAVSEPGRGTTFTIRLPLVSAP